jgi:Niemann-Pick C1 protein
LFGLLFCSFCNPVILGVGLDDTFIITGAYFRLLAAEHAHSLEDEKDKNHDTAITERIRETMEEVGLSISLTTTTTIFAFCLGSFSTIPGIRWVCLYASVTIFFDYFYQVTLFVALLTLDQRRMNRAEADATKQGKYMLLGGIWSTLPNGKDDQPTRSGNSTSRSSSASSLFTQRIMGWYARQLLRPVSKAIVLTTFAIAFGYSIYRTTLLTQEFNIEDYVPEDSYTKPFFTALDEYSSIKVPIQVFFRNVNQSDPEIQQQMLDYIAALSELPQVQHPPDFCWVQDMHDFTTGKTLEAMDEEDAENAEDIADAILSGNKTFAEQLDMVLKIPTLGEVYGSDIVRDDNGNIVTSRCFLFVRYIDLHSVQEQVALLHAQEEITAQFQPQLTSNEKKSGPGLSFFTFDDLYYYWELVG